MTPLLLLGVVHRDPQGKARLARFLERERPSFISVEISAYGREFRAGRGGEFRALLKENLRRIHDDLGISWGQILSHGEIRSIFLLLRVPYEWKAAEEYAQRTGALLQELDLSCYSREKLSHIPELISEANLRTLLRLPSVPLQDQVEAQYRRARFLFAHPPSSYISCGEFRKREDHLAQGIRRIFHRAQGEKYLHIGGWEHLLESPEATSLPGLLEDLRPERLLLSGDGRGERTISCMVSKREPDLHPQNL